MSALDDLRMWREISGRRDEFICAAKAEGMNIRQIAIETGVTRDTVYAALRGGWQVPKRPAPGPDEDGRRERRCGHCGQPGATARAAGMHLCHPSDISLPDCYRRVTVWAEPPGALLGMDPKPAGTEGIIRRDGYSGLEATAMEHLVRLTEELGLYGGPPPGPA